MEGFSGESDDLPIALVELILLKYIPLKTLRRLKSVCKSWNSVISSPSLINHHLQTNLNNNKKAFSSSSSSSSSKPSIILTYTSYQENVVSLVTGDSKFINLKYLNFLVKDPKLKDKRPLSLHGCHCNGIVCLVDIDPVRDHRVIFYNPAIGEHEILRIVETSTSFEDKHYTVCGKHYTVCGFGFGYDPKTDDYKLVRILMACDFPNLATRADVYSLRTGCRRNIEIIVPDTRYGVSRIGVHVKGRCYWTDYYSKSLLSFDMSDEKFSLINLPWTQDFALKRRLIVRNESLVYAATVFDNLIAMWVLDGDNNWSQLIVIGPLMNMKMPLTFWKEDELLMEEMNGNVSLYNLNTKELTDIPILGRASSFSLNASLYVESMVSVKKNKDKQCVN